MDKDGFQLKNPLTIYQYLLKFAKNDSLYANFIQRIIVNNNIEWTIDNHFCWTALKYETVRTGLLDVTKLRVVRFAQQVEVLLMISKFRHLSHLPYLNILNKVIVINIVRQLVNIW